MRKTYAHSVHARDEEGRKVDLASLPLVAYRLRCGHMGREYAVRQRDIVFCRECGTNRTVSRILAS